MNDTSSAPAHHLARLTFDMGLPPPHCENQNFTPVIRLVLTAWAVLTRRRVTSYSLTAGARSFLYDMRQVSGPSLALSRSHPPPNLLHGVCSIIFPDPQCCNSIFTYLWRHTATPL